MKFSKQYRFNSRQGFTLLELMIVIAVIAILSLIVIANLAGSKSIARDNRRVSDISQIQTALETYFAGSSPHVYPTTLNALATENDIPSVPKDPLTGVSYDYYLLDKDVSSAGVLQVRANQGYCLGIKQFESSSTAALIGNATSSCAGISWCPLTNFDPYFVCRE